MALPHFHMHSIHFHVIARLELEGSVEPLRIRISGKAAIKVKSNVNIAMMNEPTFFGVCFKGYTVKHIGTSITAPTRAAAKLINDIIPMPIVAVPRVAAFTAIHSVPVPKHLLTYAERVTSIDILMMKNATQIPALWLGSSTK